jgi:hypothetical protein
MAKSVSIYVVGNTPAHSVDEHMHWGLRARRNDTLKGWGLDTNDDEWKYYLESELSSKYHHCSSRLNDHVERTRVWGQIGTEDLW